MIAFGARARAGRSVREIRAHLRRQAGGRPGIEHAGHGGRTDSVHRVTSSFGGRRAATEVHGYVFQCTPGAHRARPALRRRPVVVNGGRAPPLQAGESPRGRTSRARRTTFAIAPRQGASALRLNSVASPQARACPRRRHVPSRPVAPRNPCPRRPGREAAHGARHLSAHAQRAGRRAATRRRAATPCSRRPRRKCRRSSTA